MKLTKNEIKYLSQSFAAGTPLSVFGNIEAELDGSEYQSLVDKGVIVGNAYSDEALEILTALMSPERSSRFLAQTPNYIVEKYTYKTGDKLILSENYEGELNFSVIEDVTTLSSKFTEVFGVSAFSTTEIKEVFTPAEMTVVLALADIVRKKELASYAALSSQVKAVDFEGIMAEVKGEYKNGLTNMYLSNYRFDPPSQDSVEKALASLEERELVVKKDGYELSEQLKAFAVNFLVIDTIGMYEAFDILESGDTVTLARLVASAGKNDIMTLLYDGEDVQFNTISAIQLLYNIEAVMACPDFTEPEPEAEPEPEPQPAPAKETVPPPPPVSAPKQEAPAPAADPNNWYCPSCGRSNTGNFCAGCGTKKP